MVELKPKLSKYTLIILFYFIYLILAGKVMEIGLSSIETVPLIIAKTGLIIGIIFIIATLVVIISIPITTIFLIFSKSIRKKIKKIIFIYILTVLLIFPPIGVTKLFISRQIEKSEEHAEQILNALEQYKKETGGFYPDNLEKLKPKYLTVLPNTSDGQPFGYYTDVDGFKLSFSDYMFSGSYIYSSETNKWEWRD